MQIIQINQAMVQELTHQGVHKYPEWDEDAQRRAFELLSLDRLVGTWVCEKTSMCMVPHLLPKHMAAIMAALLMHLSIATGSQFTTTSTCLCVRSRTGLVRRHGKSGYVDLLCGFDARRNSVRVQAQRLLCIAGLSSDGVREWHAAGSKFVSRHSVSCGRRKNCCAPHHLSPGNQKDNWDDMKKVRAAVASTLAKARAVNIST
jgi:hypothetical protein